MLRNSSRIGCPSRCLLLNEVLSLNAQEFRGYRPRMVRLRFLNEVLSLNAQELHSLTDSRSSLPPQ